MPTVSRIADIPIEDTGAFEDSLPPLEVGAPEEGVSPSPPSMPFSFPDIAGGPLPVAEEGRSAFPGDKEFHDAVKALPPGLKEKLKDTIGAEFTSLRAVPAGKLHRPL
jgi:hypothetical protein